MELNVTPQKKTLGQKIKYFFIKPAELFKDYKENPKWGMNLVLIALLTGISTYVLRIIAKDEFRNTLYEQFAKMPPDKAEAAKGSMGFLLSPTMDLISSITGLISVIIITVLISLVYFGLIKLFKGKVKFQQVLSIYLVSCWAANIGMVFKLIYTYFTHKMTFFNLSPGYADAFFSNVDLFILWQSILLVFGFTTVAELDEKKSVAVVALVWLGTVAVSLVLVMINK